MNSGENKRKHLEFIQGVITKMGGNSFLLKGWSISLITAVVGFAVTTNSKMDRASLLLVATGLVLVFWLIDSYYLHQERCYRALYNDVSKKGESEIDFSLKANQYDKGYNSWTAAILSHVFLIFYAPALLVLMLACSQLFGVNIYFK